MEDDEPAEHADGTQMASALFSLSDRLADIDLGEKRITSPEGVNGRMAMEAGKVA